MLCVCCRREVDGECSPKTGRWWLYKPCENQPSQQSRVQSAFLALRVSSFFCRLFFASLRSDSSSFRFFLASLASLLRDLLFPSFAFFFFSFVFSFAESSCCAGGSASYSISSSDSSSDCALDGAALEGSCCWDGEPSFCAAAFLAKRAALSWALAFSRACFSAS